MGRVYGWSEIRDFVVFPPFTPTLILWPTITEVLVYIVNKARFFMFTLPDGICRVCLPLLASCLHG